MNVFEGGRRVAKIITAIFVVPILMNGIIQLTDGNQNGFAEDLGRALGCIVIYWIGTSSIGWIVRGFLGIPSGKDCKIEPLEK